MTKEEIGDRLATALDDIDALEAERKVWIDDWKARYQIAKSDLIEFRRDVVQMRLDEQGGGE